jgi:DNA-binding NarL/FixJ family response regulator
VPEFLDLTPNILIVEDDSQAALWLKLHLESIWPTSRPEQCRHAEMLTTLTERPPDSLDLLLVGLHFDSAGPNPFANFAELKRLTRQAPRLQTLVIATDGDELRAVSALRKGANDYLPRQLLTPVLLEQRLRAALRRARLRMARERQPLADNAAAQEQSDQELPPSIPRYAMHKLLGESSRAEVWLATSESQQQKVAVKISRVIADDSGHRSLFAREYAAVAALSDPGIVEIYDYGFYEQREYLAMEYFSRGDLRRRMQRSFTPRLSLTYLRRIATALQPVHAADMMHLDLKPANIMMRNNGEVALIDFGLVKHMDSLAGSTLVGVRRGSPYYMSPEQVTGQTLDARSDIYSLGVIFYEMLTGRRPFHGTSVIDLMDAHVNSARPKLPLTLARFEPLLELMMAKNRDERLADAAALLGQLSRYSDTPAEVPQELALAQA